MNAREYLEWTAQAALRYFDLGDEPSALMVFISDLANHPGTRHIAADPATLRLICAAYHEGRTKFEKTLLGFAVD